MRLVVGVAAISAVLAVTIASFAFVASFAWPSGVTPDTRVYAGEVDDFKVDSPVYFEAQQFFMVRRSDDTFIAFYAINPHNLPGECPVQWEADRRFTDWSSTSLIHGEVHVGVVSVALPR